MALMMIGFEFFEDSENKQINLWLKHNLMALNKMIIDI